MRKVLLILLAMYFFVSLPDVLVQAWWDTSWQYRKPITVNTGKNIKDYQLAINLTFVSGKMSPDFSDIRILNALENQELSYWIESKVNSQWAYIWFKGNFTTANGTQAYVYYGNTTPVSSTANGNNTFIFFVNGSENSDSYEGYMTSYGLYEKYNSTEQGGHTTNGHGGTSNTARASLKTPMTVGADSARLKSRTKWIKGEEKTYNFNVFGFLSDWTVEYPPDVPFLGVYHYSAYNSWYLRSNDGTSFEHYNASASYEDSTYMNVELLVTPTNVTLLRNGVFAGNNTHYIPDISSMYAGLGSYSGVSGNIGPRTRCDIYAQYFLLSKYTDPEPTYSIGLEEIPTTTTTTTTSTTTTIPYNITELIERIEELENKTSEFENRVSLLETLADSIQNQINSIQTQISNILNEITNIWTEIDNIWNVVNQTTTTTTIPSCILNGGLCNCNGKCGGLETHETCPWDCP